VLARKVPAAPIAVGPVKAAWSGNDNLLGLQAALTLGAEARPEHDIVVAAACALDGPPRQSHFTIVERLADYQPGETFAVEGTAFREASLKTRPSRCTIELRRRPAPAIAPDKWLPVSRHCFENDTARDGGCEGLAPGPVTVRIDSEFRATLERGAHREGPFSVGPAQEQCEWGRIIASIVLAKDEGAVVIAPKDLPQAGLFVLLDAMKKGGLPVAVQTTESAAP
jgi:hypothetical protein